MMDGKTNLMLFLSIHIYEMESYSSTVTVVLASLSGKLHHPICLPCPPLIK
jgi:hypothetical protein